jgi:hypothetical protein
MGLPNVGRNFIAAAIINDSPTFFTNTNARLGVGDSSTAFAAGQTDLQAASNKLRKAMEATYPTRTDNVLAFQSLYGSMPPQRGRCCCVRWLPSVRRLAPSPGGSPPP